MGVSCQQGTLLQGRTTLFGTFLQSCFLAAFTSASVTLRPNFRGNLFAKSVHRVFITNPENRNKMADVNQPLNNVWHLLSSEGIMTDRFCHLYQYFQHSLKV